MKMDHVAPFQMFWIAATLLWTRLFRRLTGSEDIGVSAAAPIQVCSMNDVFLHSDINNDLVCIITADMVNGNHFRNLFC